jgi:hypothetical protein
MATSRRDQNKISKLLLRDIDIKGRLCQVRYGDDMSFVVQLLLKKLKILRDLDTILTFGHKPKRRSALLGVAHKVLARRSAEILVACSIRICHTEVAHQGFNVWPSILV